jgi:hypothetical protein
MRFSAQDVIRILTPRMIHVPPTPHPNTCMKYEGNGDRLRSSKLRRSGLPMVKSQKETSRERRVARVDKKEK